MLTHYTQKQYHNYIECRHKFIIYNIVESIESTTKLYFMGSLFLSDKKLDYLFLNDKSTLPMLIVEPKF